MDELKLLREMRSDAPEPDLARLRGIRKRAPRGRRRFMILPVVAALATAVAVVVVVLSPERTQPRVTPPTRLLNASTTLERAATVAGRRAVPPEPREDQWQYRKYSTVQPDGDEETFQEWIRYDGTQIARTDGKVEDVAPDPGDDDLSPQKYRAKLLALPTDPDKLLAKVTGDRHWIDYPKGEGSAPGAERPDQRAFRVLGVYLEQQAVMPPRLEAAIYRALARIPGIRVEEGVQDGAGRTGLGLTLESSRDRWLVLDPSTYRLLGDRSTAGFAAGFATAELASGIVDRPGEVIP
ncbi:MAG: CU044_5270 family protein [Nonomuraea sp.]|nr:CU044_5270 family protein [Nonomuraea sp.]